MNTPTRYPAAPAPPSQKQAGLGTAAPPEAAVPSYDWRTDAFRSYALWIAAKREQAIRAGEIEPQTATEHRWCREGPVPVSLYEVGAMTVPSPAMEAAERVEVIGDATLLLGDCLSILPHLGPVDAVVTSPPYDGIRDYGTKGSAPAESIPIIASLLNAGGVCVWNVADQVVDGSETGTSFRQALAFMAQGLRLHDTMIYCKEGVTFPDNNRYHPAFEYMFVFSRGAPKHFNGIKDWRNKWAGSAMHGTDRLADGTTKPINNMGQAVPSLGLRRNWWVIPNPYNGETAGHPAPMPFRMASDHIETWTVQGETVLDPFLGSGTTGVASMKLGRRFIGIEIDEGYFDAAVARLRKAYRQPDMFIERPAPAVQQPLFKSEPAE